MGRTRIAKRATNESSFEGGGDHVSTKISSANANIPGKSAVQSNVTFKVLPLIPGQDFGLIDYHHKMMLKDAVAEIHKCSSGFNQFSAHVYRGVSPALTDSIGLNAWKRAYERSSELLRCSLIQISSQVSLTKCKYDGDVSRFNNNYYNNKIQNAELPPFNPLEPESVELAYTNLLKQAHVLGWNTYAANIPEENVNLLPQLTNCPYAINYVKYHTLYAKMDGINVPSWYFGNCLSYTAMHIEDCLLDSVNLLLWGAPKLWLIVSHEFRRDVDRNLKDVVMSRADCRKSWDRCENVTYHKNLVVSPTWLRSHGIPFSIVVQNPGDLLFIRSGALHQVINVGRNICEAVNVGTRDWNIRAEAFSPCGCPDCAVAVIRSNTELVCGGRLRYKKVFPCKSPECLINFPSNRLLQEHIHKTHTSSNSTAKCEKCGKNLSNRKIYCRHILHCGKTYACDHCKKELAYRSLEKHFKICGQPVVCAICGLACNSRSGYSSHMKAKHNDVSI